MTEINIHPWNKEIWKHLTNNPERSNHALLFNGNKGLGKKQLAISLAEFLMCNNHAQSKNLFDAATHPDCHILMPEILAKEYLEQDHLYGKFAQRYLEPHTGKPKKVLAIDQIRKLGSAITTHPHISPIRVILIIEAETMNISAANAILKNLEEPPANTLFIVVSDEISKLTKTIRSRCSLINFRAPGSASGKSWLEQNKSIPADQIDAHLAMANGHPLQAIELYKQNYSDALKMVFTDLNSLWSQKTGPVQTAKNWQGIGALASVEILQKLLADLLRNSLTNAELPEEFVFFPVQQSWLKSVSQKLRRQGLVDMIDELNYAKRMLSTTVDELLVLETVSNQLRKLPA